MCFTSFELWASFTFVFPTCCTNPSFQITFLDARQRLAEFIRPQTFLQVLRGEGVEAVPPNPGVPTGDPVHDRMTVRGPFLDLHRLVTYTPIVQDRERRKVRVQSILTDE